MSPLPTAQYAANAPLATLDTAAAFLVMTLRLWATPAAGQDGDSRHRPWGNRSWREGLIVAGIDRTASPPLDRLLRLIGTCKRPLDVREQQCPRLGRDEALLVQCVSLLQHEQSPQAEQILGLWLAPAARRMALIAAQQLSAALEGARLRIPPCRGARAGTILPLRRREPAQISWPAAQTQPES